MTLHRFSLSPKEARELQNILRHEVALTPLSAPPSIIGGADVSMDRFASHGFAGFVTLTYPSLETISESIVARDIPFPYVPGLLSFREIPMLLDAWQHLSPKPDLLFVDGLGVAHPRRLGIASHLGLVLDVPTIGIAKSILIGTHDPLPSEAGSVTPLMDDAELIGYVLRTKTNVRPVIVSAGHRVTQEDALLLARETILRHRIPEPTRQAHEAVNRARRAAHSS